MPTVSTMLSDRSYMRGTPADQRLPVGVWLLSAVIAGFVVQMVVSRWFNAGQAFQQMVAVTPTGFREGRFWTLLSHGFIHDPNNLLHVLSSVVGLFFVGRVLLPLLGPRRFLGVYFSALIGGGLIWLGTHWNTGGTLLGATSAVDALLIVFCCFFPNQEMTFLLLFFPVTLRPKYLAYGLLATDLVGFVLYERLGWRSPLDLAFSAHLGGMMVGWCYYRFVHDSEWRVRKATPPRPMAMATKRVAHATGADRSAAPEVRVDLRAEVDRILDKINSKGLAALTAEERQILDRAKEQLSRRSLVE